jgi:hypothetical protein
MNPAPIKPSLNAYSDGVNPIYSASVPVLQGQLLANEEATGDIYTYTWPQLISKALRPKESIAFDDRAYPGMSYDTFLANKRITVDTLKYRQFESDALVKELSMTISGGEDLLNLARGKELFTDSNLQKSDYILFEKREDTLSEYHDPIYVEWDYTSDKSDNQAVNIVPQTLQIPAKFLETVPEESGIEYDVPALVVHQNRADNLKTDFEKLLCKLTFMA